MTIPINSYPGDETELDVPTDILCSFFYFSNIDLGEMRRWGTRIIGDSGAFSAFTSGTPVDREEFHAWAHQWREDLLWVASLDKIGDAAGTRENWLAARRDGLELVPTLHYGASTSELAWYVEEGASLIGLGGMVPFSGEPDRLMRWLIPLFKWVRDHAPDVRFHGWGISHPRLVDRLPWWSTDSSGFSSAFRFGTLRLWLPQSSKFTSVSLDGHQLRKHARTLQEFYGVRDWRKVSVSTQATRRALGRVAYKAVQLYAAWLQSRQQVTPPAILLPALRRDAELFGPWLSSKPSEPLQAGAPAGMTSTLPLGPIAAGKDVSEARGPLCVAAAGGNDLVMNPDGGFSAPNLGPIQSSVLGNPWAAQVAGIRPVPEVRGPRSVGTVGGPGTQVMKAVDPDAFGAGPPCVRASSIEGTAS